MDAAQKLLKVSAILFALALLMAAPGWAQSLIVPNTVSIGISHAAVASVTSSATNSGVEITYTIGTPEYSIGDVPWLTVTGPIKTSGGNTYLNFVAHDIAFASVAPHPATVTLTPTNPSGLLAVSILVLFDPSGTTSANLTADKTTVNLSNAIPSTGVNITNTSGSSIVVQLTQSIQSGATNWLSASMNTYSIATTATLTINANPAGLTAGTYQGTVTLTPSTGTVLNITVYFTVSTSGNGGWSANPSSIPWSFTTNLGTYPSQVVAVNVTSATPTYNVFTTQNGSVHWLLVSAAGQAASTGVIGVGVNNPFTLSVGAQANSLTQGVYTDQANLFDSNGIQQVSVTVTLTVNGGNGSGLTISPTTIPFTSALNGAQQSQVVNVISGTGGTLILSGCNALLWLTCTLPATTTLSPNVGSAFTVYVNPAGLAANTYTSSLQVQVGSQTGTVNVSLAVGGSGTNGTSLVAPTTLNFAYELGTDTSFVTKQKLVLTGTPGSWASTIATSPAGGTWLNITPSSGTALPDPSNDATLPVVSIDPTGLTAGLYGGSITITTKDGPQIVQVLLNVYSSTIILPNPLGTLVFTAKSGQPKPSPQSLFWGYSDGALNLDTSPVIATTSTPWIKLSGLTPGTATVQVDHAGLSGGLYSGSVTLTQAGAANSPAHVPILLVVNGGATSGALTFSPTSIALTSTNGSTPASTTLSVSATAATSFTSTIAYTNGSGWLTVSPTSGTAGTTPASLTVSASPTGLASGSYGATISFTANGVVQIVNVAFTVSGGGNTGNVTVLPASLTFTAAQGSSPANQALSVSSAAGAAGISFTVTPTTTSGGSWLSTSVGAGTTPLNPLTVSVNSSTLAAGTYQGNIMIAPSGGTTVNIPVVLTVTGAASISASPTQLTFNYRLGDVAPAVQAITVSGSGAFTATPAPSGSWLKVSPTTGSAPGTVNVSINTTNLTTGVPTLTGTILVAGTGGASGSTTVNVTLNVTSPLPTISRVTNAASYATGSIAPGEIITLFADDPTHPIGPATPAYLALDVNGNVATSIGGVQVTVAGYLCPMIYASSSQVSAVVPYEAKNYATASVLVKFLGQGSNGVPLSVVSTAPGVFTYNSSGTGEGAILNSDLSVNSATNPVNPAARGDIIVIYVTGEGETAPAGITGKVTTVASPPLPVTPGPLLRPSVTIGGQPADWTFAGEAPGLVSGVMQMNVVVPTNIAAGNQPIVVTIGGVPSQPGVTVALK
jgi:uncharacterized protein (TIGR03437 family)